MMSATEPLVIHILRPLMTISSPSMRMRVEIPRGSDPAPGSEVALPQIFRPASRSGRKRSRCAGVLSAWMRETVHSWPMIETASQGGICSYIRP